MGGKNKKSAEQCGAASKKQSGKPVPKDDPVLPCQNKHWFGIKVVDEAGKAVNDVVAEILLVGGIPAIVDFALDALEGDGSWQSPKTFDSGTCVVAFPELYNCEWWPQGGSAGKVATGQSFTVSDDLCMASIADQLGFRDYKSIWSQAANKKLVDTRPNANELAPGDELAAPDEKDKIVQKPTDKVWTFVVKTKKPTKVRVVLVDKDNKPLKGKAWKVSEPVEAEGTTGADGVIEFTDIPPQASTAKIRVTMKDPPPPLAPAPPPAPVTPTPYPADILADDFTDEEPLTGDDARIVDWELTLGGLESFNTEAGVFGRLNNLGFGCRIDDAPERTTRAVKAYQRVILKNNNGSGVAKDIEADIRNKHDHP